MPERIVVVGFGPVGARFVEELLPGVAAGLMAVTVVGAEGFDAYNRVLVAEYAVGRVPRDSMDIADSASLEAAGVRVLTGVTVTVLNRSRHSVTLSDGRELGYDRLVLATGSRANVPTLDGIHRVRRENLRPPADSSLLDTASAPLPKGVTVLRDLADAELVRQSIDLGQHIVVLGAGVLGMEIALAVAAEGGTVSVVYHGEAPMARNLDRGGGMLLARAARKAGVTMVNHARAEAILFSTDAEGQASFDALLCADGKQIFGDLLLLSCGVGPRSELANLAGLDVAMGILVDESLATWADERIYAIGDCAHVAPRPELGDSGRAASGGPAGLIGPGWQQADWLAAQIMAETAGTSLPHPLAAPRPTVVMLKAPGVDVVAAGEFGAEPWDVEPLGPVGAAAAAAAGASTAGHASGCGNEAAPQPRRVSLWSDPEGDRYVKMVTRNGVLEGYVAVGMPRTAAELTLLFESGRELPADRSVLLRFDGPDHDAGAGNALAPEATVCWCNGVTVAAITDSVAAGNDTVACIGRATRAGTGCGGCKGRITEVLALAAAPA